MKQLLKIGTRGSPLALAQTEMMQCLLQQHWDETISFEIVVIKTTGDLLQKTDPEAKLTGGKGIFIKELEEALLDGRIDLAVHSCKDLPTDIDTRFELAAFPTRESAHDILLLKEGISLQSIPEGSTVATSSPRREKQWLELFPKTKVEPIRGNIDTRLRKVLENPKFIGLILAEAGLRRLRLDTKGFKVIPLSPEQMIPSPGQGALAIEIRRNDSYTKNAVTVLNDRETEIQVLAERAFLKAMGGGCQVPMAAHAQRLNSRELEICGYHFHQGHGIRASLNGEDTDPEKLGQNLAAEFLKT